MHVLLDLNNYKLYSNFKAILCYFKVVKKLKTPTVARMVKSLNPNSLKAVIDVPTHWESTFNMLNRLLKLKYACVELSDTYEELKLSPSNWEILENAVIKLLYFFIKINE